MTELEKFEGMADMELRRPKNQWWEKWIPLFNDLATVNEQPFRQYHPHPSQENLSIVNNNNTVLSAQSETNSKSIEKNFSNSKTAITKALEISESVSKTVLEETTTRLYWFSLGVGFSLLLASFLGKRK
jgi:hypothetical protein